MKKNIKIFSMPNSVIIATVMVLCLLISVFSPILALVENFSVSANTLNNLIVNPNFDSNISGWDTNGVFDNTGKGENGSGSVKLTAWQNIYQTVTLKADTTYTYSFRMNGSGITAQLFIQTLFPWYSGGMDNPVWECNNGGNTTVTGTITTTEAGNYYFCVYQPNGTGYYDSFSLKEGNHLTEEENSDNLITNPDLNSNKDGWTGEWEYSSTGGEENSGALKSKVWAATYQFVTLEANTTYTYGFYVSGQGSKAKLFIKTENPWTNINTNTPTWENMSINGSSYVTGTFTTTASGNYWFFIREWGGNPAYFDSFFIKKGDHTVGNENNGGGDNTGGGNVDTDNLILNPNFDNNLNNWETGGILDKTGKGENGSDSVKLTAWQSVYQSVTLKADTTYTYSFQMDGSGIKAQLFIQTLFPWYSGGMDNPVWECVNGGKSTVMGTIKTTEAGNYYFCVYQPDGTGYYDSFSLKEGNHVPEDEKPKNLIANPKLNENKDNWTGWDYSTVGGEEGTGCVKSKSWDALYQYVNLKANQTYTYGFYVSGQNAKAKLFLQTTNPWSVNVNPVWQNMDINGSYYVTGQFTASETGNHWFFLREYGGSGAAYYDSFFIVEGTDVSVLQEDGDNLLKNSCVNRNVDYWLGEGFESVNNAHGGTKGILLNKDGVLYQENILLAKDVEYNYSFWAKSNNTSLKVYIEKDNNKKLVFEKDNSQLNDGFIEGKITANETGYYRFIIENTGNSSVVLDTLALTKGVGYVPPANGIVPGTEMQSEMQNYLVRDSFLNDNSKNLFKDADFETIPEKGTSWNIDGFSSVDGFSIDTKEYYGGKKSLKVTAKEEETELRISFPVNMHTTYTFGAWVKGGYLSDEYSGNIWFGFVNKNDDFIEFAQDANKHTSHESAHTCFARDMRWHRVGFKFYTGDYSEVTFVIRGEDALMWFDDIVLAESAYCVKQTIEVVEAPIVSENYTTTTPSCAVKDNALAETNLKNSAYWADTIITREAVNVTKDPRNLKNEVLYYKEGQHISHSYYSRKVSVKKNTDYIFTAFYRSDVDSDSSFGLYRRTDWESPTVFYVSASEPGDWKFITFNLNTKDYDELVFFVQDNGGNLVLDDVRLFEASKGVALDIDAQLKSMNSALTPLDSEENKEPEKEVTKTPEKSESLDKKEDESIENDVGSGITELKDSMSGIKLYYEDGREIRTTVRFKVEKITSANLPANAVTLLEGMKISAFKLTLLENGEEIMPNGRVVIEMPLPDGFNGEECFVYRISDEGKVTNTRAKFENGMLKFTVDKMGIFAVVQAEETSNMLWFIIGGSALLIIVVAIITVIVIKKKKSKV